MKIIYPQESGKLSIIFPISQDLSVYEIARKSVPYGLPFLIVEDNELPTNWDFSDAWEADFSNPDGFGLGSRRWFIEQAKKDIEKGIEVEKNKQIIRMLKREIFELEGVRL